MTQSPHFAYERLCPQHSRSLAAYERAASNRAAVLVPLCIWFAAWLGSAVHRPGAVSVMLALVSYVAFWGGFVARIVYIICRLCSVFGGFVRCQPCRVSLREWNSINQR